MFYSVPSSQARPRLHARHRYVPVCVFQLFTAVFLAQQALTILCSFSLPQLGLSPGCTSENHPSESNASRAQADSLIA
jgi:hypothetical protein